jgi:hypothetical protein
MEKMAKSYVMNLIVWLGGVTIFNTHKEECKHSKRRLKNCAN